MICPLHLRRLLGQGVHLSKAVARFPKLMLSYRCSSSTVQSAEHTENKLSSYSPTEGYIRHSPYDPIIPPEVTLDKYIWQDFQKWENKTAAVCIITGREYTFGQMRDRCAAFAINLQQKLKLQPRNVIAVCSPNIPEYPIVILGALEAGLTVTTVNPQYGADDVGRQLKSSNAKCIVGTCFNYANLKNACEIAKINIPIICIKTEKTEVIPNGTIDLFQLIDPEGMNFSDLKSSGITKDDMAFLPYSSGTTGLPKGVMLSHANMTVNCEMVLTHSPFPPLISPSKGDFQEVVPCVLPFFHIFGLSVGMITMLKLGCKLVTVPKFTPDNLTKCINEYKATVLNVVPPIVLFLTNSDRITPKQASHLRLSISAAAPIGLLDVERFLAKFPLMHFVQGYGLTETSPACLQAPITFKKYASVGYVVPNTKAKVIAYDTKEPIGLGPNQQGELCFQGPQVMKGYFNNEEATKNSFYPGRWFRTGDIGYYDEEGAFFITDRMKELIKVKGFQVPPAELEELLRDHPKIADAAVVGKPDHNSGELPHAFIVLKKNMKATEEEIKNFIAGKVVKYKRLEGGITFLNEIPKNATGKLLRKDLKSKFNS